MNMQESNYQYFMETDISNYVGEWIAICGENIIAHGKNLKRVVEEAKKNSKGKKFLLAKVPSEETMIF
ncbi:MAG: DUF5678 domain-containing protein [Nanoarchaeota archaeon]